MADTTLRELLTGPIKTTDDRLHVAVTENDALRPGPHTFGLVVIDNDGRESLPASVTVIVRGG